MGLTVIDSVLLTSSVTAFDGMIGFERKKNRVIYEI